MPGSHLTTVYKTIAFGGFWLDPKPILARSKKHVNASTAV